MIFYICHPNILESDPSCLLQKIQKMHILNMIFTNVLYVITALIVSSEQISFLMSLSLSRWLCFTCKFVLAHSRFRNILFSLEAPEETAFSGDL